MCPDVGNAIGVGTEGWELWEFIHDDGSCELAFFRSSQDHTRRGLEPGSKLIWTVEAKSYNDAMQRYHDHMGWSPYKPMPGGTE